MRLTNIRRLLSLCFLFLLCGMLIVFPSGLAHSLPADKLSTEELVTKHLASIGSTEDIAASRTRVATGTTQARLRVTNTPVELSGPAQVASDGDKFLLAMVFSANNYPHEKVSFDGENAIIGVLTQGGRTPLGTFIGSQSALLKHGLIGGVLSSAWPLYNLDRRDAKVSYTGMDKINGKPVHKLKYTPRNAGDLTINLYFDANTFQHVRSQYEYVVSARQGAVAESSISQQNTRYKLVEEFSDFQPTGKLVLPHTYIIDLTVELPNRTQTLKWTINLQQFVFNEPIDPRAFKGEEDREIKIGEPAKRATAFTTLRCRPLRGLNNIC